MSDGRRDEVTGSDTPWDRWSDVRVFDAIFTARATRVYQPVPLPDEVLAKIVRAGTFASSSGNTQPWDFVVVTDDLLKRRLKASLAAAFAQVDERRAQTRDQLIDGAGRPVTGNAAVENVDRVSAIVMVFWNPDRGIRFRGQYEENADGTLREANVPPGAGRGTSLFPACQNMILAAQALGVQSLFTTFFGLVEQDVKDLLHVPPRMFLEAAVFFGYGDEGLGRPRWRPLAEVAHWNDWGTPWAGPPEVTW
jgi:nitroreductase